MIAPHMISLGFVIGGVLAYGVHRFTKKEEPPSWFWMLSFFGFFVALNWIFLLANEVVGLLQVILTYKMIPFLLIILFFFLQALGQIFSISEAIMGLTVFALVNYAYNALKKSIPFY